MERRMEDIQTFILHDPDGVEDYTTHITKNSDGWIGQIKELPETLLFSIFLLTTY